VRRHLAVPRNEYSSLRRHSSGGRVRLVNLEARAYELRFGELPLGFYVKELRYNGAVEAFADVGGERIGVMPDFLLLHVRWCCPDTVKDTFDVHVDRLVPVVDLEALQWRMRHQSGVVEHDVDSSVCFDRPISEALYPPRFRGAARR
jgi:hypothetical protein